MLIREKVLQAALIRRLSPEKDLSGLLVERFPLCSKRLDVPRLQCGQFSEVHGRGRGLVSVVVEVRRRRD